MSSAAPEFDAYHAITVVFNVKGAADFIAFCVGALGAEEIMRRSRPDDTVIHADLKLGDTIFWVSDAIKDPPTSIAIAHFVSNCDATFHEAVQLGAKAVFPPAQPPWGGRWARVEDAWGNQWTFVTRSTENRGA
jgi:PhnB protein